MGWWTKIPEIMVHQRNFIPKEMVECAYIVWVKYTFNITLPTVLLILMEDLSETDLVEDAFICISGKM